MTVSRPKSNQMELSLPHFLRPSGWHPRPSFTHTHARSRPYYPHSPFISSKGGLDTTSGSTSPVCRPRSLSLLPKTSPLIRWGIPATSESTPSPLDAGQSILHTPSQPQKEMPSHVSHPSPASDTPINPPGRDFDCPESHQSESPSTIRPKLSSFRAPQCLCLSSPNASVLRTPAAQDPASFQY